jgi:hypothetical protein
MKRVLWVFIFLLLSVPGFAATGAITAVTVNSTGFDIDVTFTGFSPFGTFNTGLPGTSGGNNPNNALIVLTVTPPAYTPVSGMNNGTRIVHGTWPIRYAYPNAWAASTSYVLNNTVSDGTYIQKVVTCSGTCTSASSHPTWNTSLGGTTVDNSGANQITWMNMGALPNDAVLNTCYDENTSVAGSLTVRIALDEEIYSDETAVVANIAAGLYYDNGSGGTNDYSLAASNVTVTNNSTLRYPKPVFRWTSVPYQRVTGPFVLEMTGGAHFAQNQSEVAAVTYTCTGNTSGHSNSVTVSRMTISTLFQDVNPVIVYAGTMPLAGFTQSEQLTCNALVYPWWGDANSVLNTSNTPVGTSTTSLTIGTGSQTLTTQSGLGFTAGQYVSLQDSASSQAALSDWMYGTVTSYIGTTLVVNVTAVNGSGAIATWNVLTTDGFPQPSEALGPQSEVNDPGGAYGAVFAPVTTSGSDSTCTGLVFTSQTTAQASAGFASVGKAASCIAAYNSANYSRSDAGGGTILMGAGASWGYGTTSYALGTMETWLIVKPFSSLTQSQVVFTSGPGADNKHLDSDGNTLLTFQGVTFNSTANFVISSGGNTGIDSFWLNNVSFSGTATDTFYSVPGALYTTQSSFPALAVGFSYAAGSLRTAWALIRGATAPTGTPAEVYTVVGSSGASPIVWMPNGDTKLATSDGAVVAFNTDYNLTSAAPIEPNLTEQVPTPHGAAWVQNLFENTAPQGFFFCGSTAPTTNCDNWIVQHMTTGCGGNPCPSGSTAINSKFAFGYTAGSSPTGLTRYNWSIKWVATSYVNSKSDDYMSGPNPANVGNWPLVYGTGFMGNLQSTEINLSIEFFGLGVCGSCAPQYINDQTLGTGNGNYHILSTSQNINIAPWTTVASDCLPYDIEGHPRVGRVVAGVYTFGTARRGWR